MSAQPVASTSWIVADMDSTLIRKEGNIYGDLNASPCCKPLLSFLKAGGSLLVVTSDDGYRPFTQMWDQIPIEFRSTGQVWISTGDGAALFCGDDHGEVRLPRTHVH